MSFYKVFMPSVGGRGREICGGCGHVFDMTEKTEGKCSQCGGIIMRAHDCCVFVLSERKKTKFVCSHCGAVNTVTDRNAHRFCCFCGRKVKEFLEPVTSLQEFLKGVQGNDES